MLVYRLVLLTAIFLFSASSPRASADAIPAPPLGLRISCDKPRYISGESIIINCELTNNGRTPLNVFEPSARGNGVRFVYESGAGEDKQQWGLEPYRQGEPRRPFPHIIGLAPCQKLSRTSELQFNSSHQYLPLHEGKYRVWAYYNYEKEPVFNWTVDESVDYLSHNIESNTIEFEVVEASAEEKAIQMELARFAQEPNRHLKLAILRDLDEKFPDSVFAPTFLKLLTFREPDENFKRKVDLYRRLALKRVSSTLREECVMWQAFHLEYAGDLQGALDAIKAETAEYFVRYRRFLTSKLNKKSKIEK